ncbi:hypothetical protein [Georgenia sp. SUBG003]
MLPLFEALTANRRGSTEVANNTCFELYSALAAFDALWLYAAFT